MELKSMGKVLVAARIENLQDLYKVEQGVLEPDEVRRADVDALVDTAATMLSLPKSLVDQLGLKQYRKRTVRTVAGTLEIPICEAVRLTIQGRDCTVDVAEIADDCPSLIGQIPLEALDFLVDPVGQRLIGNPDHGGEHMIEIY